MPKSLFQIIPDNFFSPLSSPGKMVYWECIEILFRTSSSQLSFGVERDVLVGELEDYFSSSMAADIADGEYIEETLDAKSMSARDKANFMLRKLEAYGWIYTDTDYSYVQRTSFRDYAIAVIRTLQGIEEEQKTEYQGYIYAIYTMARANGNNAVALRQMVENTEALITGLKSLNANIKLYIDELTKHSTVSEILKALLDDYYSNVIDRAYHRLLTSDNVSKFRPEIIERLDSHARSQKYLRQTAKEIAEMDSVSQEEALERTLTMLHYVIDSFRQMDEILEDINKKNTRYQKAAVNRAKFLMTSNEDIRGQLKEILCFLNERIQEESLEFEGVYAIEETDRLIRLFTWGYLDTDSLYSPIMAKGEFAPGNITPRKPDYAERERKRRQMQEKLDKVLDPKKISEYVDKCLAGRDRMAASETLEGVMGDEGTVEAFVKIIYIRLYGQRKVMPYRIEPLDWKMVCGYRFRDFLIIRK
ncbi:MAG: DUF5716 family protein [Lachnospiraceae bacterium]|nr:DUF5716 family protein [Lachnospiraceae bacterium]